MSSSKKQTEKKHLKGADNNSSKQSKVIETDDSFTIVSYSKKKQQPRAGTATSALSTMTRKPVKLKDNEQVITMANFASFQA